MNKPVGRRMARQVLFLTGLCAIAGVVPGPLFADSVADGSLIRERVAAANVDDGAAAPPSALSVGTRDVEADALTTKPARHTTFDMSHVERVRIRVWGNADLSGEYGVDPDSSISIPRVGRIDVSSMSPADLEKVLAEKLSAMMRSDMTVAIEVVRFRPYFIMGQVAQSGAIEWRPGLKVIQAISLARGVLAPGGVDPVNSVAGRQYRTQLTFARAQLARLKAERGGANVVATADNVTSLIKNAPETSRPALTSLIGRQNDMLREQREIMDARLVGLQREREAAERELEAAKVQEKAIAEHLDNSRAQLANIEVLRTKKLVTNARYFDHKSNLMLVEVRYAEARSVVERAQTRVDGVEQQLATVPQQRRADLNERIDSLEREVAQLELASGVSASETDDQDDVLKLSYHIARESSTGVRTIPATVFTEIMPGDVLIVGKGLEGTGTSENPLGRGGVKEADADTAQRLIERTATTASPMGAAYPSPAEIGGLSSR